MEQQRFTRKNMAILEAARRQEKKRNRRTVFYVFLLLFVSLVFLTVCVTVFLKVQTITVVGNEKYSYEEIIELVPITIGDNMFSFKSDEIEENISKTLPYIGKVEIKRDLPSTVLINIQEEKPYFSAELAGDTYIISSNMKVLDRITDSKDVDSSLTTLTLNNVRQCIVGTQVEFVNERTLDAIIDLYGSFSNNYIENKIVGVDVRSRFDIYINYDNRFEVYVGDTENLDIKMRFLIAIINELEDGSTGVIDVSNPQEATVALS